MVIKDLLLKSLGLYGFTDDFFPTPKEHKTVDQCHYKIDAKF